MNLLIHPKVPAIFSGSASFVSPVSMCISVLLGMIGSNRLCGSVFWQVDHSSDEIYTLHPPEPVGRAQRVRAGIGVRCWQMRVSQLSNSDRATVSLTVVPSLVRALEKVG